MRWVRKTPLFSPAPMIEEEDIPAEKHVQSLLVQTKAENSRGVRARPFEEYAAITTEVNVGPELQLPCDLWCCC